MNTIGEKKMGKTKSKVKKKQRRMKEKDLLNQKKIETLAQQKKDLLNQKKIETLAQQNKKRKFLM